MPAPTMPRLRRYWPVGALLLSGLAVSAWLGAEMHRAAVKLDGDRFQLEANTITETLETDMERYEERLARLADHCAQFEELPTLVWFFRRAAMTDLYGNLPLVAIALYCPKVDATNFGHHFERGQEVWKGRYVFEPVAAASRPLALPVWQRWAREDVGTFPPGTDMAVVGETHPSLLEALEGGDTWISPGPAGLVRPAGRTENGFWFAVNLFAPDQTSRMAGPLGGESPTDFARRRRQERRARSIGLLAVFISTDLMLDETYNDPGKPTRVHVRLYAAREPGKAALLNPRSAPPAAPRYHTLLPMRWYGRNWCVAMSSTPLFEAESQRNRAWGVAGSGAAFSLLASALLGVSLRARARHEQMTAEILEARDALAATEREREKLGHDLHDGAIQSLYAIQLGLSRTAESVAASLPEAARILGGTRQRVDEVIAELRGFILSKEHAARSEATTNLKEVLAGVMQREQGTTRATLHFEVDSAWPDRLPAEQGIALILIARTALANCLRHAQARHITLRLQRKQDTIELVIEDDGRGFQLANPELLGMGLRTMRSRVADVGGLLVIDSSPGRGTHVRVALTCAKPEPLTPTSMPSA